MAKPTKLDKKNLSQDVSQLKALIDERRAHIAEVNAGREVENHDIEETRREIEALQDEASYLLNIKPRPQNRDPKNGALI